MADVIGNHGLLRSAHPIKAKTPQDIPVTVPPGQELRVYADSGDITFVVFGLTQVVATGVIDAYVGVGCDSAGTGWVALYTADTGKAGLLMLRVYNRGSSVGAFSCGVTVTEISGGGGGV